MSEEKLPEDDGASLDMGTLFDEFSNIAASLLRRNGPVPLVYSSDFRSGLPGWNVFSKLDERLKYNLFMCALVGSLRGAISRSPETFNPPEEPPHE